MSESLNSDSLRLYVRRAASPSDSTWMISYSKIFTPVMSPLTWTQPHVFRP